MYQTPHTTTYSRKIVTNWLKSFPCSQNFNDGVLFCKILQKVNPNFGKYMETPRTQYQCVRNFKTIQKHLQREGLYKIQDATRFASSKDYFEFSDWLYGYHQKCLPEESLVGSNISKIKSANDFNFYDTIVETEKDVDFYQDYKNDTANLLILNAREQDVEYLRDTLEDMIKIIEQATGVEEIKESLKRRFYGKVMDEAQ